MPRRRSSRVIHVFGGTIAQYIKTAPLLRLMDADGVPYRLIDSGQHAGSAVSLRDQLDVREPDTVLSTRTGDVDTVAGGIGWSLRLAASLWSGRRIRREVFGDRDGICVVQGDTISTLLAALMAKRAGLDVAHIEAGLRSGSLLHPFPEELARIGVMRVADVLFPPGERYADNLRDMGVRGRIVTLEANTTVEALEYVLEGRLAPQRPGPAVVTMHRLENLRSSVRARGLVELVAGLADRWPTRFVVHPPTRPVLEDLGAVTRLEAAGVELVPMQHHGKFAAMLRDAPLVVTDGGSIQEECAVLGVPTLLWRDRTERDDGLGTNVVLAHHDRSRAEAFLAEVGRYRRPPTDVKVAPSRSILDTLLSWR